MNALVEAARACLGTPFVHQGRKVGVGFDCAGLLVHCLSQLGVAHCDMDGYARSPYDGMLEQAMDQQEGLTRLESWLQGRPGDILILRVKRAPQHIAILSQYRHGAPYVIHASEVHGGVVEHRLDAFELMRIMRVYRIRES